MNASAATLRPATPADLQELLPFYRQGRAQAGFDAGFHPLDAVLPPELAGLHRTGDVGQFVLGGAALVGPGLKLPAQPAT